MLRWHQGGYWEFPGWVSRHTCETEQCTGDTALRCCSQLCLCCWAELMSTCGGGHGKCCSSFESCDHSRCLGQQIRSNFPPPVVLTSQNTEVILWESFTLYPSADLKCSATFVGVLWAWAGLCFQLSSGGDENWTEIVLGLHKQVWEA